MNAAAILYLLVEEVIGKVIEDHWVGGINGISLRQQLIAVFDGVGGFVVEFNDRQANQGSNTVAIQLKCPGK
jgi:hypothetical protein